MARKRPYRCVVVALSAVLVTSALVIMISPSARAAVWKQSSDTDFKKAVDITNLDIIGTGDPAYLQLKKGIYDWYNKNPLSPPSGRYGHSMVYDSVNGRVFLFGGYNVTAKILNETWRYSLASNTWTLIQKNAPPPARYLAGMAFDTTHGVAVLYGGYDDKSKPAPYTWEYNAVTGGWTNTTGPAGPTGLSASSMTYDSTADKVILAAQGKTAWETWAYDVPTDTWTLRSGSSPPSNRASYRLAYYPAIDRTVLYGGDFGMSVYDETWEYNYGTDSWTDMTGSAGGTSPGGRTNYGFVSRSDPGDLMLWGGSGGTGSLTDIYLYTGVGSSRTWSRVTPMNSPPERNGLGMAYVSSAKAVIVFGGRTPGGVRLADTWAYEAGFVAEGWIKSMLFDSLHANTQWQYISWNQSPSNVPLNTEIRLQIATGNDSDPNSTDPVNGYEFHGPDGTPYTYYSAWGAINPKESPARYIMYKANLLCFACADSPHLEDVTIIYDIPAMAPYVVSKAPVTPFYFSVPVTSPIWINFSEPMNTGTVSVQLTGVTLSPYWYDSETRLRLDHVAPLNVCTQYRPRIVSGQDKDGNSLPGLPIEWLFVTVCPPVEITSTYPHDSDVDIPWTAPIYVNFSSAMEKSSVVVTLTPSIPLDPYQWSNGDKTLKVPHSTDFADCTQYTVEVTGNGAFGQPLGPGPVPNPWSFWTHCTSPSVVSTVPYDGQYDVPVNLDVKIVFSRKMNTATVNVVFTPSISLSEKWNTPLDTELTLSHPPNFVQCKLYAADVTGKDTAGNDLQGGHYAWSFFTECGGAPYVVDTNPVNNAVDVPVDNNVTILFNEAMVEPSVVVSVEPTWSHTERWVMSFVLNLESSTPFDMCKRYWVNVTDGVDQADGLHLVDGPVPRRFTFLTVCPTNPFVVSIVPPDGAQDVANDTSIVVTFSKPMDTTTFMYTLKPDITLSESWNTPTDTIFRLDHPPLFLDCTDYTFTLAVAEDKTKNPLMGQNVFKFKTYCPPVTNPYVVQTDPKDGDGGVPVNKVITIWFSKPMNPVSLAVSVIPNVTLIPPTWDPTNMIVMQDHSPFLEGWTYNVTVWALDQSGNPLVPGPVPNPWEFTTIAQAPYIIRTSPYNYERNVGVLAPIVVSFSKPMDTGTVSVTVVPSGISFTRSWDGVEMNLTMTHSTPYIMCQLYQVTVSGKDKQGNDLVAGPVPNPWRFYTVCPPAGAPGGLQVRRQANGIDILLEWRAALYGDGYHVYDSNSRFAPWPWTMIANITTTSYLATGHQSDGLTHYYIVRAYNGTSWQEGLNSTMGVKLHKVFNLYPAGPNTQWFSLPYRTIYKRASDIANELGSSKIDVVAKWDPVNQKSIIYHYFRGVWRGTNFQINPGDGLWLGVRSTFSWAINGTDYDQSLAFTYRPMQNNYYWISLPYTNAYRNAAAISAELTSSKILEVGRYNASSNTFDVWRWDGTKWVGNNFAIMSGDGIYLRIASSFAWTPKLITPEIP